MPKQFKATDELKTWQATSIDPCDLSLLGDPLEFLLSEHARQRQAAISLLGVSQGESDLETIQNLLDFFERDYPAHIADEELGLFPLLREKCLAEDRIDTLVDRFSEEHSTEAPKLLNVVSVLEGSKGGDRINENDASFIRAFAEDIQQHLALENAVLLPIARVRFEEEDLKKLSTIFKKNRQPSVA